MSAGQGRGAANEKLPPLVYVCVMPGDEAVVETKPGKCPNPKCGMDLVPVRLDSKWWCPTHQTLVVRDGPGKCPRDGKDLVPVTLAITWTCADQPNEALTEPGTCKNGQPRKINYAVRAHGDHNPKHDGQFFMAADAWHHIEGAYPADGLFRVFFYDNFTKPLAANKFAGTVTVLDPKSAADKELGTFPLTPGKDSSTMEAKIPPALSALPFKAKARIKFAPELQPQPFDFNFAALSKDPAAPAPAAAPKTTSANTSAGTTAKAPTATGTTAAVTPKPSAARPASTPTPAATAATTPPAQKPATSASTASAPSSSATAAPPAQAPLILDTPLQLPPGLAEALDESKLPTTSDGLLTELNSRVKDVEKAVNEGNLAQVWLPATGAKTVALVLEQHASTLSERQRVAVRAAVKRMVTAAWELDAYGDLGNRNKISDAYQRLANAAADVKAAYDNR